MGETNVNWTYVQMLLEMVFQTFSKNLVSSKPYQLEVLNLHVAEADALQIKTFSLDNSKM